MGKEHHDNELVTCQAPFHATSCDGIGRSKNHFTPKCIALKLRWTKAQIDDPFNIQWLSLACHADKDKSTPEKYYQLQEQLRGKFIGFGEHK